MRKYSFYPLILALISPVTAALAQQKSDDMSGINMSTKPTASAQTNHLTTGIVKKVDAKTGVVTLAHDPVKSMNWPAMTMGFKVKDQMLLDKFAESKKVEVQFQQQGKDYVITGVK